MMSAAVDTQYEHLCPPHPSAQVLQDELHMLHKVDPAVWKYCPAAALSYPLSASLGQ